MVDIDVLLRDALTDEQHAAATAPEREILALACAGSGKSRTLAYRIARLIAEGAKPEGIVAFTFTDKAAESIKIRVADALARCGLDPALVGAMYVGTIHAWCRMILGSMDARYRQYEVLDDNRLLMYLMSRYPRLGAPELRSLRARHAPSTQNQARYFETLKEIRNAWVLLNEELRDIADVADDDPDLATVLDNLGRLMDNDRFIDFSTMVRRVADALNHGDAGAERALADLEHVLVDEYQDINPVQDQLIQLMHERAHTLVVVGDDDQAIYSWRGADVGNILTFRQRYPSAAEHSLVHNFRSTPDIVDAAEGFVAAELGASRIPKQPTATPLGDSVESGVLWFPDRAAEADWVADRIAALLGTRYVEADGTVRGLTPADFAILMRSTRGDEQDGSQRHSAFTRALAARDIVYNLEAGGGLFDRPQAAALREAFCLLYDASPTRPQVQQLFAISLQPAFPNADLAAVIRTFTDWGRRIHTPVVQGAPRQRLYPQQLLHDLLAAVGLPGTTFDDGVMADLGAFSRILQDAETVYVSIDSSDRFQQLVNFLRHVAEHGYDVTGQLLSRPDAVTVSTVHKAKGLEFPVVFVVDVEAGRFPLTPRGYQGWLPSSVVAAALSRGAYGGSRDEEARLFYTAITRAERFLYVSGAAQLPAARRARRLSTYAARLTGPAIRRDLLEPAATPAITPAPSPPRRRGDESVLPTTFSQIRYYLRCPRDYQLRVVFGFSPPITEMFGFGQTVHAAVGKLHEIYPDRPPALDEAGNIAEDVFHLKHVPPSRDPIDRPGGYEQAKGAATRIVKAYAHDYGSDFTHERQVERPFEVPLKDAVISGAIDLLLRIDEDGTVTGASVIDFKTMEGGPDPEANGKLDWEELALQVQLYARGATQVLGENAKTGAVHLLKDGQRVAVPVDDQAVADAVTNVEWAVERIIAGDFPKRPSPGKCAACDFRKLCDQQLEPFTAPHQPPPLHLPGGRLTTTAAFSDVTSR